VVTVISIWQPLTLPLVHLTLLLTTLLFQLNTLVLPPVLLVSIPNVPLLLLLVSPNSLWQLPHPSLFLFTIVSMMPHGLVCLEMQLDVQLVLSLQELLEKTEDVKLLVLKKLLLPLL